MKKSVQNVFLKMLVESRSSVAVYLKNGVKLKGRIIQYDGKTVLLEGGDHLPQLILLDAVSTVAPTLEKNEI